MNRELPRPQSLVILGGGVCGLYAALTALRAGAQVTLVERAGTLGGLAAGTRRGENYYDLGVHMLHAFDESIFTDVAQLMGEERIEVDLDARIRWGEGNYRYPLKFGDLMKEMPKWTLLKGVMGLLGAEIRRAVRPVQTKNAQEALIAFYGTPLYRFFFEEFTTRYWGIHPREISDEFVKRKMPRLSAVDFVKKTFFARQQSSLARESSLEEERLHYSQKGAYALPLALEREILRLGGIVHKQAEVRDLSYQNGVQVTTSNGLAIEADLCLSTLPLNTLCRITQGVPPHVYQASQSLRYKAIVVFGLLIKRNRAMEGLYTYYRERVFHRVGEPKNAGLEVTPADHTVLIVEMTCEKGDEKWQGTSAIKEAILKDLAAENLCTAQEVVEWHTLHYQDGYPIYALGYEKPLGLVNAWVESLPWLRSAGRQGEFAYPGMHRAMRMGAEAVEALL